MRQAPDEPMTALAFTSRDRLVAGCGDHQPWVAVPADSVLAQFEHAGVSRVIIDGLLAPEQRWTIAGSPAEPTVHT